LHGDVLMWLMKTLLTSGCTNQRGAGHQEEIMVNQQQIREAQRLASFAVLHRNAPAWEEAKRLYAVAIGRTLH
ncbi:hypothetical protein YA42_18385, partial [Enterobacter hormaechei subsp. oharae]